MYLHPGDTVDIIAPGSVGKIEHLLKAIEVLEAQGLCVRIPPDLYGATQMVSNTDERRWAHLKSALTNRESKAIWCVRGGYGALRLLPRLARLKKPQHKKLLIGYSDITSLHIFLNQCWRWPTLHGPLLDRVGKGVMTSAEQRVLLDVVMGRQSAVEFGRLRVLNTQHRSARARLHGTLTGGNLMVAQSTLGTPFQLEGRGKILLFEEIAEKPYRIDRILHHMEQAHVFSGVKAVIFGQIVGVSAEEARLIQNDVLKSFAARSPFPVLTGLPSGHGDPQWPVPFHRPAILKISGPRGELEVQAFSK